MNGKASAEHEGRNIKNKREKIHKLPHFCYYATQTLLELLTNRNYDTLHPLLLNNNNNNNTNTPLTKVSISLRHFCSMLMNEN